MDHLKLFISFSGKASLKVAEALRDWLPAVLQRVKPFVSQADLGAGVRWAEKISAELRDTSFGILCLTPENVDNRWILFEAGALTKLPEGRAVPYLLNLSYSSVQPPLAQFQMKVADKEGTWDLVSSINGVFGQDALAAGTLEMLFNQMWPQLEARLIEAMKISPAPKNPDQVKMLEEVVEATRRSNQILEAGMDLLLRLVSLGSSPQAGFPFDLPQPLISTRDLERGRTYKLSKDILAHLLERAKADDDSSGGKRG